MFTGPMGLGFLLYGRYSNFLGVDLSMARYKKILFWGLHGRFKDVGKAALAELCTGEQ